MDEDKHTNQVVHWRDTTMAKTINRDMIRLIGRQRYAEVLTMMVTRRMSDDEIVLRTAVIPSMVFAIRWLVLFADGMIDPELRPPPYVELFDATTLDYGDDPADVDPTTQDYDDDE